MHRTCASLKASAQVAIACRVGATCFAQAVVSSWQWRKHQRLPLVAIVTALSALNLERVVFDVMGGMRPDAGTAHNAAYGILFAITLLSMMAAPFLVIGCVACIVAAQTKKRG